MGYFEIFSKLKRGYYKLITQLIYKIDFKNMGKNSKIINPLSIRNACYMDIGSNVTINSQIFMLAERYKDSKNVPELRIEDGATIGNFNHIVCCNKVIIGKNVLTADKVYISDNCHYYHDINCAISQQGIYSKGQVCIGEDSWIGENVCIIGATVGKHCIIGANSVVTRDIPDYCVAVGIPAKIIKKYNQKDREWVKNGE